MTALETIIAIRQGLQRLGINTPEGYETEQFELAFNTVQDSYISSKVKKKGNGDGYEIDVKSQADIGSLTTVSKVMVYKSTAEIVYCILPDECVFLMDSSSFTTNDCEELFATKKNGYSYVERTGYVDVADSTKESAPFYETFEALLIDDFTVNLDSDGFEDVAAKFELMYPLMHELNRLSRYKNQKFYWERYRNIYVKDSVIIVLWEEIFTGVFDYGGITIDGLKTSVEGSSLFTYISYDMSIGTEYDNRQYDLKTIKKVIRDSFYKSTYDSPVCCLIDRTLQIYINNRFIVNSVNLFYVRKPQRLSLLLNSSSELPDYVQKELVRLTVEYCKVEIENMPGYQLKSNDNDKRLE